MWVWPFAWQKAPDGFKRWGNDAYTFELVQCWRNDAEGVFTLRLSAMHHDLDELWWKPLDCAVGAR